MNQSKYKNKSALNYLEKEFISFCKYSARCLNALSRSISETSHTVCAPFSNRLWYLCSVLKILFLKKKIVRA